MRTPADIQKYRPILGLLFIGLNAGSLLAAVIVSMVIGGGGLLSGDATAISITSAVAVAISGLLILLGAPGVIVGIGLMNARPWADTAANILGAISLPALPFGTALGAFTLWVYHGDRSTDHCDAPSGMHP